MTTETTMTTESVNEAKAGLPFTPASCSPSTRHIIPISGKDSLATAIAQTTHARPNCYMCFYQRRYEWAGLLEHHPQLFDRAERIELEVGVSDKTREHAFYWISEELPLRKIREVAEELVQKRITALVKMFRERLQRDLWQDALIDGLDMAQTSCGLYCGK